MAGATHIPFLGPSKMKVKLLSDLAAARALAGKRVFIRADLNVPQDDAGNITEDTRIRASVASIRIAWTTARR